MDKVCLLSLAEKALFSWLHPCLHLCIFFCHIHCSHHSESVLLQADPPAWNAFPAFVLTLRHSSTLNSGVISSSSTLPYTVATSHTRLLSTWNVACEKDELIFSLLLILKTEAQGVWKKISIACWNDISVIGLHKILKLMSWLFITFLNLAIRLFKVTYVVVCFLSDSTAVGALHSSVPLHHIYSKS